MRTKILTAALVSVSFFSFPAHAARASEPCIPLGGTSDVEFDRPDIDADNMPADAEWKDGDGNPQAFDADTWSPDDPMGKGMSSDGGETVEVPVTNNGGHLFGPANHSPIEGGLEGDCIEVYVRWSFRFKVQVSVTTGVKYEVDGVGGSGSVTQTVTIWQTGHVYDGPKEVCPC
ncbi:MAG: hypothetical protein FJ299_14760 [Planctomycetes bacterium]|nr:hypothetical protein [Planctomycetota bacterium]